MYNILVQNIICQSSKFDADFSFEFSNKITVKYVDKINQNSGESGC